MYQIELKIDQATCVTNISFEIFFRIKHLDCHLQTLQSWCPLRKRRAFTAIGCAKGTDWFFALSSGKHAK